MRNTDPLCPTVTPWKFGTLARRAKPGILELCHTIGNVMGVLPKMLKSYALWVYFHKYSPSTTRYFPKACCNPAWNSFLNPAGELAGTQGMSAAITSTLQPVVATTRFSLKGVSKVRA